MRMPWSLDVNQFRTTSLPVEFTCEHVVPGVVFIHYVVALAAPSSARPRLISDNVVLQNEVRVSMNATVETVSRVQKPSRVLETEAGDPASAVQHFRSKLAFETDPSDVYTDIQNRETGFIVIDARRPESYAKAHIPGSVNLPYRTIDAQTTADIPKDIVLVTYCAGVYCNASTRAAAKLSALGFRVKEMLDGLEGWTREGYPLETGSRPMTV